MESKARDFCDPFRSRRDIVERDSSSKSAQISVIKANSATKMIVNFFFIYIPLIPMIDKNIKWMVLWMVLFGINGFIYVILEIYRIRLAADVGGSVYVRRRLYL